MVYTATRGDLPVRLGPTVPNTPGFGPSKMSRDPYTNPEIFELEREKVLNKTWLLAGRSEQMPNQGDWLSFESHGETIVITRQPDGSLAAFHNVCPHRGPSFVTEWKGCGAKKFKCPYHGWLFDTTGKVIGVPDRIDFDEEHLKGLRSPQVLADEWGGWIWVNFDVEGATPLKEWIGEDIMSDLGAYKMEDMILLEVVEWDVPVSYKAVVDGFNEVYHAFELHHTGIEWQKAARGLTMHVVNDHNFLCYVPRHQHLEKLQENWDHHRWAICHYVVFPNTVFNCNPEHIQVFNPIPIDVDRTRFLCWELIYPGDEDTDPEYEDYRDRQREHWQILKGVVGEDIAIYDQLKRTKRSSAYKDHILSDREFKLKKYHDTFAEMIRD